MQTISIFAALLACAAAAPGFILHETEIVPAKTTITKSSQVVDHGSTLIHTPVVPVVHAPVIHAPVVHTPVYTSAKTTITKSNQVVNHGGTTVVHSIPVVHTPVHAVTYHAVPEINEVVHAPVYSKTTVTKSNHAINHGSTAVVHAPVVSPVLVHSPVVALKSGDSAVSHHSSTVHETVPVVKSVPLYTLHH